MTGIMSFQDQKVLAVGWSRKITTYDDSDPDVITYSQLQMAFAIHFDVIADHLCARQHGLDGRANAQGKCERVLWISRVAYTC